MSDNFQRKLFKINARDRCLVLGQQTTVMGVLNLTPDSFSGDGRLLRAHDPVFHCDYAIRLINEGADIIDVGGESTRPDAPSISVAQEIKRVIPAITLLRKRSNAFISVDTTKIEVAQKALDAGVDIINNVMGTRLSGAFLKMVKKYDAALIIMHSRGNSRSMRSKMKYKDLIEDILDELSISLEKCLDSGIKSDKIIIDPGIGFAKTARQSFLVLRELKKFARLKRPVLIGTSRKSFIGQVTQTEAADRLWGTTATVAAGIMNGAHIIRVHDVKTMKQVAMVMDVILNPAMVDPPSS